MAEEGVDFKNLEKELSLALEADAKYQRENDAKFRAVSQKVANYDEFRDIVLASHLKPLNKNDKVGGMTYQQWNTVGGVNNDKSTTPYKLNTKLNAPTTEAEFKRDMLKASGTKEKYDYMVYTCGPLTLAQVLKVECDIAEMTKTFNKHFQNEDGKSLIQILQVMSQTKRFALGLDFLDVKEVEEIKDLLQKIKNLDVDIDNVCNAYKINLS